MVVRGKAAYERWVAASNLRSKGEFDCCFALFIVTCPLACIVLNDFRIFLTRRKRGIYKYCLGTIWDPP